jgi:hypothetical protein
MRRKYTASICLITVKSKNEYSITLFPNEFHETVRTKFPPLGSSAQHTHTTAIQHELFLTLDARYLLLVWGPYS